jgi:hypothetical protein
MYHGGLDEPNFFIRQSDPAAYVCMMLRVHEFSATIVGDMDTMEKHLEDSNAFKQHDKAKDYT